MSDNRTNEYFLHHSDETVLSFDNDDGNESDYSLDYEFTGPRYPKYRPAAEDDIASELSDEEIDSTTPRFDMWDDDPYNDYTWESNDMQLTKFIKRKRKQFRQGKTSFWTKERGWPKQLPYSCSSTNHDQSANAMCLVQSDYGLSEQLYAVYRDRIIECGRPPSQKQKPTHHKLNQTRRETTWIESSDHYPNYNTHSSAEKFMDTHQSVPLPKPQISHQSQKEHINHHLSLIDKFKPYTKYIKRSDYPGTIPEDSYLFLGFEPQCIAHKYGYLAIGGVEGEFELYCCMDPTNPVKIWGTKFKGKDNVMLMTNTIQLVRWKNVATSKYEHMLIGCMNEAGLLFYQLPPHSDCKDIRTLREQQRHQKSPLTVIKLHTHLRSFHGVPINDAKLSPDGTKLVCVGDDNLIFMIDIHHCKKTGEISIGNPIEIVIPPIVFDQKSMLSSPYSSQYVAWSASSEYFAHTSDSHNLVLIWRAATKELLYTIDAAGYTYAISFHPHLDHILVFTNRYGYFHTVDFSKAKASNDNDNDINILTFDYQTKSSRGHKCVETCIQPADDGKDHAVFHTRHLSISHEITMVSFRGEIDKRLRILAKINGIEWSKDGKYLYVATKKRVLAFQFNMLKSKVPRLLDITGMFVKDMLEKQEIKRLRKRRRLNEDDESIELLKNWSFVPESIQFKILENNQHLASHW